MALTEGHVWNDCVGSELTSSHDTRPPNSPEVLLGSQKSVTVESQQRVPRLCLALAARVPSLAKHNLNCTFPAPSLGPQ